MPAAPSSARPSWVDGAQEQQHMQQRMPLGMFRRSLTASTDQICQLFLQLVKFIVDADLEKSLFRARSLPHSPPRPLTPTVG